MCLLVFGIFGQERRIREEYDKGFLFHTSHCGAVNLDPGTSQETVEEMPRGQIDSRCPGISS